MALYREYFNIDEEFFAAVNPEVIKTHPDYWKKFYPHETFVSLLGKLIDVVNLKHKSRPSLWVEGAYGTGKSHAVLTLKNLLDADDATVEEYFKRFPEQLSNDMLTKFNSMKGHPADGDQPILTVMRYGSDYLHDERDLLFGIQESVEAALTEPRNVELGMTTSDTALTRAIIEWLSDPANRAYFNTLMTNNYQDLFDGIDVDELLTELNTYTGKPLGAVIAKVMKVANDRKIKAMSLTKEDVIEWLRAVIKDNNLKAIVFIWDEFTEYFRDHSHALTTFQALVELSETDAFYLIPVTHDVGNLFSEKDGEWKKITGRFLTPFCTIELPDNMAFRLMGSAMEKKKDEVLLKQWDSTATELYNRTHDARDLVIKQAKISDMELKGILPMHPYAALILKYMASLYDNDVRSMFNFIKDGSGDDDDDTRGFMWFIHHFGKNGAAGGTNENPLLTVDMLWDFFYEKGKQVLAESARNILDNYGAASGLKGDQPRVLKAILLMNAIAARSDNAKVLLPTKKNLEMAFEGSDLDIGVASKVADSLVKADVLYMKAGASVSDAEYYAPNGGVVKIKPVPIALDAIVERGSFVTEFAPTGAMRLRYDVRTMSAFSTEALSKIHSDELGNRICLMLGFAQTDKDGHTLSNIFAKAVSDPKTREAVFVDASAKPLSVKRDEQIAKANGQYIEWKSKDSGKASAANKSVNDWITDWRKEIKGGSFTVYSKEYPAGQSAATMDEMLSILMQIDRARYKLGLETFASHATDTMWTPTTMKNAVGLGASNGAVDVKLGAFSCVPLDLAGAWTVEEYWKKQPALTISKIKQAVNELIEKEFANGDRISIKAICSFLSKEPYGFMACGQTAFVLGFLLKEYTDGSFSCSDGITSATLNIDKLKEIVSDYMTKIMGSQYPDPKYRDQYIVKMTPEIKAFIKATETVFGTQVKASRMEDIRDQVVRPALRRLPFPLWLLQYAMAGKEYNNDKQKIVTLIELYVALANSGSTIGRSDNDIATDIGKLVMDNPTLAEDLHNLKNDNNIIEGMQKYLAEFEDGVLPRLSAEINDGGQYVSRLKKKFSADAANWVWFKETVDQQIRNMVLEYRIVAASNKIILHATSFDGCIDEWCNAAKNIKVSYLYAKTVGCWNDLGILMELLYNIKKNGQLAESKKEEFLQAIEQKGADFKAFYADQISVFTATNHYVLGDLDAAAITEVFNQLPGSDNFVADKATYQKRVKDTLDAYNRDNKYATLRQLWADKTGTSSPKDWSLKFKMPVVYMVPDAEILEAKKAFAAINKKSTDEAAVDNAIAFLQTHDALMDSLNDSAQRDAAFRKHVIGDYDVVLVDIDSVKSELNKKLPADPYDWADMPQLHTIVKAKAEYEYNATGSDLAMQKIDSMDAESVKKYLKNLIGDNMTVGIEIIRSH